MAYEIVMPQLSDSMETGKLIRWHVRPGQKVSVGDTIAEVESDKAVMEVQTFQDGVVRELLVEEGKEAPVGSVIARIETNGEATVSSVVATPEPISERKSTPHEAEHEKVRPNVSTRTDFESETIAVQGDASPRARKKAAAYGIDIDAWQRAGKLPVPAHEKDIETAIRERYFTPKARRLLERYGIDAERFAPFTRKVRGEDVEAYASEHDLALSEPLDYNRKAVIAAVTRAAAKPTYHIYDSIDATLLRRYSDAQRTITVWLLALLAETMMRHKACRSVLKGESFRVMPHASVSIAVAYEEALYMPTLRHIDTMSLTAIATKLAEVKEAAKSGRIPAESAGGSTFGFSNLGMTGIERFDAMVGGDDAGILAVGAEKNGHIAVTMTFDHRVVNGLQGAEAMRTLKMLAGDESFFKGRA
jgi:pyruvate dehydrogenase E2 component (dihydrolipoamide acetyltransferase)